MLDNFNIICEKWEWDTSTELEDINFFSEADCSMVESIDLKKYLIDLSTLDYTFDSSDNNNFFFETSDITFTLSGIKDNYFLRDFFGLFTDTTYIKYLIKITKASNNELVYKGIVNQEAIEETFSPSQDSQQIEVQALGFEKEFKSYYETKDLTSLTWTPERNIKKQVNGQFTYEWKYSTLQSALDTNFNSPLVNFELEEGLDEYKLMNLPFLGKPKPNSSSTVDINNGTYEETRAIYTIDNAKKAQFRTDIIITKDELNQRGLIDPSFLKKFTFKHKATHELYGGDPTYKCYIMGFNLKIAHTSASTLSDFSSETFSTHYSGTLTISVNKTWTDLIFDLNPYFEWNGEDNIVIRMCCDYTVCTPDRFIVSLASSSTISNETYNGYSVDYGGGGCTKSYTDKGNIHKPNIVIDYGTNNTVLSNNSIFLKTGYDRLANSNRFDWLQKTCNAMGWIFFHWKNRFYIRNRSYSGSEIIDLDYNKFIEFTITKSKPYLTYDYIWLHDGIIFGGDGSGLGTTFRRNFFQILAADSVDYTKTIKQWSRLHPHGNVLVFDIGYRWMGYEFEDDNTLKYRLFEWTSWGYGAEVHTLNKKRVLKIDCGDNGNFRWGYACGTGLNFAYEEGVSPQMQDTEFNFNGHYGHMLYKIYNNYLYNYEDYIHTDTFTNNFTKYLIDKRDSRKITVLYNEILLEPMVKYTISNYTPLSGIWNVNSIKYDFKTETTELELQLKTNG